MVSSRKSAFSTTEDAGRNFAAKTQRTFHHGGRQRIHGKDAKAFFVMEDGQRFPAESMDDCQC
jgi:hypothetical protein